MSLIDCDLEEMSANLPFPKTPGAPNLSDTGSSSPFVFSSFGSLRSFEDDDDDDNQHSLLSGTSADSPPFCTPASDDPRGVYRPITPPGCSRSNFGILSAAVNGGINRLGARGLGLGLMGVFKDDGTPLHVSTISHSTDDDETDYSELPSFLEGLTPDLSFLYEGFIDDYQESAPSTPAIDRTPSPRLLDDVFSQLAIKSSSPTSSRPRSYGSGNGVRKDGPEEPDCDDVFIERGRMMSVSTDPSMVVDGGSVVEYA